MLPAILTPTGTIIGVDPETVLGFSSNQHHTRPMQDADFPKILFNASDENDTISWHLALQVAKDHSCFNDFRTYYGTTTKFGRVDVGELLVWLGY
jgi:hypothetical protein